jgi:hypothetical protein
MKTSGEVNERTIWGLRQNHPELVVQDIMREFSLQPCAAGRLRAILMERGVNKWLLARRRFIDLKHRLKTVVQGQGGLDRVAVQNLYAEMQSIAKMPRWVEWGTHAHKKMKANEADIVIKGRSC